MCTVESWRHVARWWWTDANALLEHSMFLRRHLSVGMEALVADGQEFVGDKRGKVLNGDGCQSVEAHVFLIGFLCYLLGVSGQLSAPHIISFRLCPLSHF